VGSKVSSIEENRKGVNTTVQMVVVYPNVLSLLMESKIKIIAMRTSDRLQ
jgi:hypothetical protein